jgi:hypothetical protein
MAVGHPGKGHQKQIKQTLRDLLLTMPWFGVARSGSAGTRRDTVRARIVEGK